MTNILLCMSYSLLIVIVMFLYIFKNLVCLSHSIQQKSKIWAAKNPLLFCMDIQLILHISFNASFVVS